MFASAAEYYRQHPNGEEDIDENNVSASPNNDDDRADDDPVPHGNNTNDENDPTHLLHPSDQEGGDPNDRDGETNSPASPSLDVSSSMINSSGRDNRTNTPRTLRISGAMFLEDALERIRDALNEKENNNLLLSGPNDTISRRLTCLNLGLDGLLFDEDEIEDTLLARLMLSRNWESIELHACRRVGVLLDLFRLDGHDHHNNNNNNKAARREVQLETLSLTGGQAMSWDDVQSLAKAIPHIQLHTLHLFMTFPKPPVPFYILEEYYPRVPTIERDEDCEESAGENDDSQDEEDHHHQQQQEIEDDPSTAMKILVSGMQSSCLHSLEISLARRDTDTFAAGLSTPLQIGAPPPHSPVSSATLSFVSLHRLDLRHSFLSDDRLAQLVNAIVPLLCHHGGQLRALDLRGHCECQAQTLRALAQPSGQSLHQLWISKPVLTEDRMDGLSTFFQSLSVLSTTTDTDTDTATTSTTLVSSLQTLDIGNYMIENRDMEVLIESLVTTGTVNGRPRSTLRSLDMLSCGMTITGMALWEAGLPRMSTLQRLAIPADGGPHVLKGLVQNNTSLQSLDLEDRVLGRNPRPYSHRPHDLWLDLNRGGRRVLRMATENNIAFAASLWPFVLERAQHPTVASKYYGGPRQAVTVLWVLLRNRVLLEQHIHSSY